MDFDRTYFDTQYRNYERQNPARKLAFYRRLVETAAGTQSHPRILDIGCAFGLLLSRLDTRWERYGVDASDYAIQKAKQQLPEASFDVARDGKLPYQGPFHVISAFDVLEHVPDVNGLLSWVAGHLSSGGGFAFVVPVYDGPTAPIIRVLDRDPTHIHKRDRGYWLRLASRHFQLVDWWGIYRFLLPGNKYIHAVTRSCRRFAPAIACLTKRLDRI